MRQAIPLLRAEGLINVERPRGTFVRSSERLETVPLHRGDIVTARMPTEAERRSLHLGEGVPVLVVHATDSGEAVHPADQVRLSRP